MPDREWRRWWRQRGEFELGLILWTAWDPIGGVPPDEYDSYALEVARLLRADESVEVVASYLTRITTGMMGLEGRPDHDFAVAQTLKNWYRWATELSYSRAAHEWAQLEDE